MDTPESQLLVVGAINRHPYLEGPDHMDALHGTLEPPTTRPAVLRGAALEGGRLREGSSCVSSLDLGVPNERRKEVPGAPSSHPLSPWMRLKTTPSSVTPGRQQDPSFQGPSIGKNKEEPKKAFYVGCVVGCFEPV